MINHARTPNHVRTSRLSSSLYCFGYEDARRSLVKYDGKGGSGADDIYNDIDVIHVGFASDDFGWREKDVELQLTSLISSVVIEHAGRLYTIEGMKPQRGYYFITSDRTISWCGSGVCSRDIISKQQPRR